MIREIHLNISGLDIKSLHLEQQNFDEVLVIAAFVKGTNNFLLSKLRLRVFD
jgi:hypothetical protein